MFDTFSPPFQYITTKIYFCQHIYQKGKIMEFLKFSEYLDKNDKLQEKPIVTDKADTGPKPSAKDRPEKAVTSGKNWKNNRRTEAAQVKDNGDGAENVPYSAPGTDPGLQVVSDSEKTKLSSSYSDGLVKKGDEKLVYNPKTDNQQIKIAVPKLTKTETFIDETKGLNSDQYIDYILNQTNGKTTKQIMETVNLIKDNANLIETLVREAKRQGALAKLVESVLNQPETYDEIAINLANVEKGKDISRNLARAINEITAPPEDEDEKPASKKMPPNKDSIDTRGRPVRPEENVRHARTVKDDIHVDDKNIMASKMMRPEHHLIEALASYRTIRASMNKLLH
jgi:hypothetical protein